MEDRSHKAGRAQERVRTICRKRLHYERVQGQRFVARVVRTSAKADSLDLEIPPSPKRPARKRKKRSAPALQFFPDNDIVGRFGSNLKYLSNGYGHWAKYGFASTPDLAEQALGGAPDGETSRRAVPRLSLVIAGCSSVGNSSPWAHLEVVGDDDNGGMFPPQVCEDVSVMLDWENLRKKGAVSPDDLPDILQTIFQAMSEDMADVTLQTMATQTLDHFAVMGAGHAVAIASAGLLILVRAAEAHKCSGILQEAVCRVLRAITISGADCRTAVAAVGGIRVVVTAMTHHLDSVAVQLVGCKALKELAANSATIQEEICSLSGIEAVLRAMERHASVANMQEVGCGVLRNMSAGQAKQQDKIAMLGGVRLVSVAMALHRQEVAVQWAGCWALFCVTVQNATLRDKVVASGGLGHVLQAMSAHRSSPRVQEAGCWAIKVLATVAEKNVAMSGRASASQAMADHPSDEQVQKAARAAWQSAGACPATLRITQRVTVAEPGQLATNVASQLAKSFSNHRQCSPGWNLATIPE